MFAKLAREPPRMVKSPLFVRPCIVAFFAFNVPAFSTAERLVLFVAKSVPEVPTVVFPLMMEPFKSTSPPVIAREPLT